MVRIVGRLMQIVALAVPPVAIVLQVVERVTVGQMLLLCLAAFSLFYIGRLIEGYARA